MDRPANDITTEARVVSEVYLIDPTTKKPYAAGGGGGGSISAEATAAPPSYEEGASAPLSMDLAGNLRIGGTINASTSAEATAAAPAYAEGTEQPLSQTLAGDLRVSAKASGNFPVTGTFWQATQPVSAAALPLPSGAATLTGQTAVTGSKAAGTAATSSILTGGVFNTSLPTLTNGQQAAAQMDASGRIYTTATVTTLPALVAGSAIIGNVRLDQTTGGTTNGVVLKKANGDVIDPDTPAIIDSGVKYVDVTLSTDTAAYASGDLIADAQVVAACVRSNDATGALHSVMVIDEDDQKAAFTVYLASASSTWGTENSAPSISDANARTILGFVDVATGDYKDLGGVAVAFKGNAGMAITPATGTDDIYVAVVNGSGTPTYTATGLKLRLGFLA